MNHKTIAILGLTGRTGKELGNLLLEKGYNLRALVRNKNKLIIQHPSLQVIEGSLTNESDLESLVKGADALISVLGHSKNSPNWYQTETIKRLIPIMQNNKCERIILLTGSGVVFEDDVNTFGNKFTSFLIHLLAKNRFEDGAKQCEILKNSDLNWTIFRTPLLTNGNIFLQKIYIGNKAPGFLNYINRLSVAQVFTNELEENKYQRRYVFIYK